MIVLPQVFQLKSNCILFYHVRNCPRANKPLCFLCNILCSNMKTYCWFSQIPWNRLQSRSQTLPITVHVDSTSRAPGVVVYRFISSSSVVLCNWLVFSDLLHLFPQLPSLCFTFIQDVSFSTWTILSVRLSVSIFQVHVIMILTTVKSKFTVPRLTGFLNSPSLN